MKLREFVNNNCIKKGAKKKDLEDTVLKIKCDNEVAKKTKDANTKIDRSLHMKIQHQTDVQDKDRSAARL